MRHAASSKPFKLMLFGVLCLLAGCADSPQSPNECTGDCVTTAFVTVVLRDSTGARVERAPVQVLSFLGECGGVMRGAGGATILADAGEGRIELISPNSPHVAACVEVTINPDAGAELPVVRKTFSGPLEFRAADGSPRDSLRVEVVMPWAP
jgi:hypothetical protein